MTELWRWENSATNISIHTTTQVVTRYRAKQRWRNKISIHTTTQVVTVMSWSISKVSRFQSTPPRRWWRKQFGRPCSIKQFQSTPPRRWWRYVWPGTQWPGDFNPHHHAGGDWDYGGIATAKQNFNPHHHAGGDAQLQAERGNNIYFNPHHHAGGDLWKVFSITIDVISIHTTTQVVTFYAR